MSFLDNLGLGNTFGGIALKTIRSGLDPLFLDRTAQNLVLGKKKHYSDQPWRDELAKYEAGVKETHEANAKAFQAGEDVNLHNLQRQAGSARAAVDNSAVNRGLYNTTVRDQEQGHVSSAIGRGYTALAGQRAQFEQSQKPDAGVYGPLIEAVAANPKMTALGRPDLGKQFDAENQVRNEGARAAFEGGPDSARTRIYSADRAAPSRSGGIYSGVGDSLNQRATERRDLTIAGNEAAMGQLDPKRLHFGEAGAGDRIFQLAAQPVKQTIGRQLVGAVLPVAGSVIGGIYGGAGGAMAGGALGGAAGRQVGGTYAGISPNGPVGGTNDSVEGAIQGLGFGASIAGNFKGGSAGGWRGFFGQDAPKAAPAAMPQGAQAGSGAFPSLPTGNTSFATPTANYASSYRDVYDTRDSGNYPSVSGGLDIYGRANTRNWGTF